MDNVVSLKGCVTFNSNINNRGIFAKCAIGYSNYNNDAYERGSLIFLTNNNANTNNINMQSDIRMSINSDGNVGIGTATNINEKLVVNGNIVANTLSAVNLSGAGSNITRINADYITDGTLLVNRGGTGLNILQQDQLIVGNGTNTAIQSSNLFWNNTTSTLVASNIVATTITGIGSNITNINANNITLGTLPVTRGGTGVITLGANQLLVGNGEGPLISSGTGLTWINDTLTAAKFSGDGGLLTNVNATSITNLSVTNISGVLSVNKGGTGVSTLVANRLLVGNGENSLTSSSNLTWDDPSSTLVASNIVARTITGVGSNITRLNANSISDGVVSVNKGGTGVTTLVANQLLVGNGANYLISSPNLMWDNASSTLVASNIVATTITGIGSNIKNLDANNISGIVSVNKGGTGFATLVAKQLLVGNGTNSLISSPNLTWDNASSTLVASNIVATTITGIGRNIKSLDANNILGVVSVNKGGTGVATLVANELVVGNGENSLISSPNLTWDNASSTLVASNIVARTITGIGSNITSLNAYSISTGTINKARLPIPTSSDIGAVKKGSNIDIGDDGTISVNLSSYLGNASINGDLTVNSNLIVHGTSTRLNTDVYTTERLEITNEGIASSTLIVRQKAFGNTNNIISISNYDKEVLNISNNGTITTNNNNINAGSGTITATNVAATNLSGIGTLITNLNANNITTGTINSERLPIAGTGTVGGLKVDEIITTISNNTLKLVEPRSKVTIDSSGEAKLFPLLRNFPQGPSGTEHIISNQTHGNGKYIVHYTSRNSLESAPTNLFSGIGSTAQWQNGNMVAGTYSKSPPESIVGDTTYFGEGVKIQLPVAIRLISYKFLRTYTGYEPKDFKIYGSSNGTTWFVIEEQTNAIWTSAEYTGTPTNTNSTYAYNHFALSINKVSSVTANTVILEEWEIFGKEPTSEYKKDSIVKYVAGNQSDVNLRNTGSWQIIDDVTNITNIDASNITSGTLPVTRGGTGTTSLVANQLVVGNGTYGLISSSNLTWDNASSTLFASNIVASNIVAKTITGIGSNITNLNANSISDGILSVNKGGTGMTSFTTGQLLLGNGANSLVNSGSGLTYDYAMQTLNASKFSGNGQSITNINANNITIGTLPVTRGGTGGTTFTTNQLLIGNDAGAITASGTGLTWNSATTTLNATSISGAGSNITHINATNITSGAIRNESLPTASDTIKGCVKVGVGLTMTSDTLSLNSAISISSGNVGIGISPTTYKLQVSGAIGATGDITAYYSDERLKNIKEYVKDVLPSLSKINVFKYNCNDLAESYGFDKSKNEIGLSAQEIQRHYPELVTLAPFDSTLHEETQKIMSISGEDYLTLKYDRLSPLLLQAIKELNNKYNALEDKHRILEEKYNKLEYIINNNII